jgi:hypothetical protein
MNTLYLARRLCYRTRPFYNIDAARARPRLLVATNAKREMRNLRISHARNRTLRIRMTIMLREAQRLCVVRLSANIMQPQPDVSTSWLTINGVACRRLT